LLRKDGIDLNHHLFKSPQLFTRDLYLVEITCRATHAYLRWFLIFYCIWI